MKFLIVLFLVLMLYSNSQNIQYITMGDTSLKLLRSSTYYDYFYFSYNRDTTYTKAYLLLFDNWYSLNLNSTYYCSTSSYPSDTTIKDCTFHYKNCYGLSKGRIYYYQIPISKSNNYIIIKYSGKNSSGIFKARSIFIDKVPVDYYDETILTMTLDSHNYFYTNIDYSSYNYLYFNLTDLKRDNLEQPLYYCKTNKNPENYSPISDCNFISLNYYNKRNINGTYEYYYKLDISSFSWSYVVVKYYVMYSSFYIHAKSSYTDPTDPSSGPSRKTLSSIAIVFIAIGGVSFIGIIIIIAYYYCRKKEVTNTSCTPNETTEGYFTPNYPLVN